MSRAWAVRVASLLDRGIESAVFLLRRGWCRLRSEPLTTVVELEWRLGDEVMALPSFEALARVGPRQRLVARVRHPELLQDNPHVHAVNPLSVAASRWLVLRGERPGVARRRLLEERLGLSLEGLEPRLYLSDDELAEPVHPLLAPGAAPRVVVHPSASQPAKRWPDERWQALASELMRRGLRLVEVGTGPARLPMIESLAGRTTVRELARALAQADVVVGDDSGPLHVALAVGTPVVGLFGATRPELLYAPGSELGAVTSTAGCRFCWSRWELAYPSGTCPLPRHECMEAIRVSEVVEAVLALVGTA
jgi:ADP-heptose:LPS heptosyltransferase